MFFFTASSYTDRWRSLTLFHDDCYPLTVKTLFEYTVPKTLGPSQIAQHIMFVEYILQYTHHPNCTLWIFSHSWIYFKSTFLTNDRYHHLLPPSPPPYFLPRPKNLAWKLQHWPGVTEWLNSSSFIYLRFLQYRFGGEGGGRGRGLGVDRR